MNVEQIVREYIDKTPHLSLATVSGNRPWVCEVHFVYDKELNLYFRSLPSTRHCQELTANPSVAGNIVRQHGLDEFPHGIYFVGTAAVMSDPGERERIFPYFASRLGTSEAALEQAKQPDAHQFYKITVAKWYAFGKFDGDKAAKLELDWCPEVEAK